MKKKDTKYKKIDKNITDSIFSNNELGKLTDEELVELSKAGNKEAIKVLIQRYSKFLFSKVIPFYIPGGEREDIIQEAYIGFLKAVEDFDKTKGSFFNFVNLCVQRQITTAIKSSNRNKARILRNPISLESNLFDEDSGEKSLYDYISPSRIIQGSYQETSIEDTIIDFIEKNRIKESLLSNLTHREKEILKLRAQGLTYSEIGKKINVSPKSVDNAIQRIKKKIKNLMDNID
ncbi:MAG: sigma-70 family RNA polymerase sigma factor [Candidatus Calescibacterium sp.]|nr:sigma-70 family RNA polymerase sigma factor [Candidatus Calescibacterium sp.]MDW8132707.1 sigma-70 family RNA polymerase sigma factor [Candidatus Calescibacterium sp.]